MDTHTRKNYSNYRSNYKKKTQHAKHYDYRETFLIQCIACGIALCAALFVSVIDVPYSQQVKDKVVVVIETDMLKDASINKTDNKYDILVEIKDSIKSIFGKTTDTKMATADDDNNLNKQEDPTQISIKKSVTVDSRIDEDILKSINDKKDFYGESEKKLQVPIEKTQKNIQTITPTSLQDQTQPLSEQELQQPWSQPQNP